MGINKDIADSRQPPRMSANDFYSLWRDKWLRQYLVDVARAMAKKNNELFEDLLQEAWLKIDKNLPGLKLEYYAREGYRAMENYYRKEARYWRLLNGNWSDTKPYEAARRVRKRYKIILKKNRSRP